jgi:sodium/hydrogen exchanger-like protein 3
MFTVLIIFKKQNSNINVCHILNSTSFSQLDSSTWNIDMQELEYNPSKKDMTDAKIHHLLAEELCKPYRRVREIFLCKVPFQFPGRIVYNTT